MSGYQIRKYDQYKAEYNQYTKSNPCPQYTALSCSVNYNSEIVNLIRYESLGSKDSIFLIVPSIFNSPEIFFLAGEKNFVQSLRDRGEVYLINWREAHSQLKIENLVHELNQVIKFIKKDTSKKIHLIGHCIGGNICIGAAQDLNLPLMSLTLMTTPWDFSHFSRLKSIIESFELEYSIKDIDLIPKIYVQIMFFLMFPAQYKKKIDKYFSSNISAKKFFMQVEDWLQSGISIPKSLYMQIIEEFCLQNISHHKKWKVDGKIVNPSSINIPTCIIYAKEDQIVPYGSIVPLQKMIKPSTLIKVEGGHIGYLIKRNTDFQEKYNNWLNTILTI